MKRKIVLILSICILIIFSAWYFLKNRGFSSLPSVTISGQRFLVELARTPEEQQRGLAGHKPLSEKEGMLFVFDGKSPTDFWMKGMIFPIDIIWIKNNKVIYLVENAQPPLAGQKDSELKVFIPPEGAEFVLEVKAGGVKKYDIKINDSFTFIRR